MGILLRCASCYGKKKVLKVFLVKPSAAYSQLNAFTCSLISSVTRLGDFLHFGQLYKAINLTKSHTFLGNFCKGVKNLSFF